MQVISKSGYKREQFNLGIYTGAIRRVAGGENAIYLTEILQKKQRACVRARGASAAGVVGALLLLAGCCPSAILPALVGGI